MTLKDLYKIISSWRERNQSTAVVGTDPMQKEAKAFVAQRYELYVESYQKRMKNWFAAHPDKKYFEPSLDEMYAEMVPDEWLWYFLERIQYTPEQRYQQERNPSYGWNHLSDVHTIEEDCKEGCRFWPEKGRIESIEILEDYKDYQEYDTVRKTWEKLDRNEVH